MRSELLLIPHSTMANSHERAEFNLVDHTKAHLPPLKAVFAESLAGARSWLKAMGLTLDIFLYHRQVPERQVIADLEGLKGHACAFISDCGYPCIADPGSGLVALARKMGFHVRLLPGTSAIVAAIALSGLDAQRFSFHGYLPREEASRKRALELLEQQSAMAGEGWQGSALQVFIETPYRHGAMLKECLQTLQPQTMLCVASEIGNVEEQVRTYSIGDWREKPGVLAEGDRVAVYMLLAPARLCPKQPSLPTRKPSPPRGLKGQERKKSGK